jgi:nitrite reductase/ring-hydroxylating ferredoxin subunit/uncharacterized membrane protein
VNVVSTEVDDDARDRRPSAVKRLLQGRPFGHPLHPLLVHLPIGLWGLSFVLDVIAIAQSDAEASPFKLLNRTPLYLLLAGLVLGLLAMATGLADYVDVRADHPARRTATWHMIANLAAFAAFGASAVLRVAELGPAVLCVAVSGVGVALVSFSGYLGGKMVYGDGVAVGRHRSMLSAQPETLTVNTPPDAGWVDVMDTTDLPEGVPLRADVNGHAIVLLREQGGGLCAFQEFCTHRCGPLSEGTVEDGQIICPWHRSRFDVHTGKPTHGPAKVDLKVYAVREQGSRTEIELDRS